MAYASICLRSAVLSLLVLQLQAGTGRAQECPAVGQLYSIDGDVEVLRQGVWRRAALNQTLCARDTIRTGSLSRAAVMLINEAVLRVDQDTSVHLADIRTEEEEPSLLDLSEGAFQSFSRQPRALEVNTPYLNAAVQGTEFVIRAEAGKTSLTVFEGTVAAANSHGSASVGSGQSVSAGSGQAPRPFILVRPRDAVQWGLYYPPILAISGSSRKGVRPEFAASAERAAAHDIKGAFAALEAIPAHERDGSFYLYKAALLLSVGRVDEAREIIDWAIAHKASPGLAYALRAVIEVVQNEKTAALKDAQLAVKLEPGLAAPKIALSYAQQANFDLKGARDTLLEATARHPENALAWARLGELWLMFGYRKRALQAAENGVQLAPKLERVHLVFGFAALTEFRTKAAREAFARAIELDSADPLARFGLGLAIIRDGALHQGRRQLEMAVGLDSSNALLRSYLGKAYFEEKRGPLDAVQFDIAKELDPLDPTPYLYDAIRLQSINRPVDAMLNMKKSIELNDNRAVYRSRQLLDSDRATRGANLAQIYDELGFTQIGLVQGYQSVTLDPGNTSPHRFLADAYVGVPRREIARVSELLQAQMLQDININPVQPSLAETNLSLVTRGGPFTPGLNEYTQLFERNDVQFVGSGLVGNDDTLAGEGIVSALYDRFSISAGAFSYDTDGWRLNNNIKHEIYNFFAQAAVTPDFNVQVELRRRESIQGDLAFNFDPEFFNPEFTRVLDQDTARAGARISPSPNSDLLLSFIYSDINQLQTDLFPEFIPDFDINALSKTYQTETQYIYQNERFNLVSGFSYVTASDTIQFPITEDIFGTQHLHPYGYANLKFPNPVTWTFGIAYDDFLQDPVTVEKVSPKLGVRWDITPSLSFRAAIFRWIMPTLSANRSLEPTQVAGFNQVFDDLAGDVSWRRGLGLDWQATKRLHLGAEATWREIDVPIIAAEDLAIFEQWNEQFHRAYVYWAPTSNLSLSAEVVYDAFEAELGASTSDNTPQTLKTLSVPVGIRYFASNGLIASAGVTYVDQEVVRDPIAELSGFVGGREQFAVVDIGVGWRFPKRLGIASLTVYNLFDQEFFYQDDNFREFRNEPSTGLYSPERRVVGRATLYF